MSGGAFLAVWLVIVVLIWLVLFAVIVAMLAGA